MENYQTLTIFDRKDQENHKEYAYRVIRDNIMTLKLTPGMVINEAELSELLEVSRTPVHEAITKLKDEALIDIFPQKGSYVSQININNFREGYFLRLTVEPVIIKLIEGSISEEERKLLADNLELQEKAAKESKNANEFLKLDNQFHRILYELAGKTCTWTAVRSVNSHFDRVRYMDAILNESNLENIYEEHKWIYYTVLVGLCSEEEIRKFYEKHLGGFLGKFYHLIEENPHYFSQNIQ